MEVQIATLLLGSSYCSCSLTTLTVDGDRSHPLYRSSNWIGLTRSVYQGAFHSRVRLFRGNELDKFQLIRSRRNVCVGGELLGRRAFVTRASSYHNGTACKSKNY